MSSGFISEDEWQDMVGYLYNESDSSLVNSLIRRAAVLEKEARDGPAVTITSQGGANSPAARSAGTQSPYYSIPTSFLQQSKISKPQGVYTIATPNTVHHSADVYKSGVLGYNRKDEGDVKRLGYSSRTLQISLIDPQAKQKQKQKLKLSFPVFVKTLLDFQLQAHKDYLSNFVKIFRHVDRNGDGVLSAQEFRKFYAMLRKVTEDSEMLAVLLQQPQTPMPPTPQQSKLQKFDFSVLEQSATLGSEPEESADELVTFVNLMKMLDPYETDRVTFSSAVTCLHQLQQTVGNAGSSAQLE
ncbi:hypothetical protein EON64_15185 [archaeon]|nr:MAG: hypothetical protein EON64_15185 [archaeon]